MLMILNNMGQALSQQGKVRESCMVRKNGCGEGDEMGVEDF